MIAGQTGKIAPADKIIYACRDNTSTVGNLSLQTSSILSKKAAESISALVLDVKYGKLIMSYTHMGDLMYMFKLSLQK